MAVCSISFLTRAGMCAPGRGTSTRLCRYVRAVPRSIHTPVPVCVRKCCTPSTRLCRYVRTRPHSIHTPVPVCVRKCCTPSTRLCRYVRTRPRNIHTPGGQPVLIEPHTCMHPCPDGKTHQTTTRSNVDGRIIEPFMIPPRPPISMLIVGEGCPKRASATEL